MSLRGAERRSNPDIKELTYTPHNKTHRVVVDAGCLTQLPQYIGDRRAIVIYDAVLPRPSMAYPALPISGGESAKTWETVQRLCEALIQQGADRHTVLVAMGGGSILDAVGFVASILFRGVPWISVPTTLLAQADVALGGKTAINAAHGKNLVGSFHFPEVVLCDTTFLETLSERDRRSGYAEIVKHALIADAAFFETLEQGLADWPALIFKSLQLKQQIIGDDWFEAASGSRQLLNLGHTFGHAYEKLGGYAALTHGEAVSLGMCTAFDYAVTRGLCPESDVRRVKEHLATYGLPVDDQPWRQHPAFLEAVYKDKKRQKDQLTLILPTRIGHVEVHRVGFLNS